MSQYLYLLVKVRTYLAGEIRVATPEVAIPIPSGEGQNKYTVLVKAGCRKSQYLYLLVKVRTDLITIFTSACQEAGRNTYTFW